MNEHVMSPEMTMDDDYKNDDSTHHYPGHVYKEDVEVEVVEDNSEKGKNKTTIPWEIGVATEAGADSSSDAESGKPKFHDPDDNMD